MGINWILVGWIIDIVLNGIVWLIIAAVLIPIIEVSDKWTRKAITFMDKADKWIRKALESSFEWMRQEELKYFICLLICNTFWDASPV